jgi:hypothetical protein
MNRAKLVLGVWALVLSAGCGTGQPHMHEALDHLRAARAELEAAIPDKGGHRVKAIELTDAAIHEAEAGIRFAANR